MSRLSQEPVVGGMCYSHLNVYMNYFGQSIGEQLQVSEDGDT